MEIDTRQALKNLEAVKCAAGSSKVCAVLKANAYGMGAAEMARIYEPHVYMFAVATLDEALELRQAGICRDILVLGNITQYGLEKAVEEDISVTVYTQQYIKVLEDTAEKSRKKAKVHFKIETGMNRLGLMPSEENMKLILSSMVKATLSVEGIFTHFAVADEADKSVTVKQAEIFLSFLERLRQCGAVLPIIHAANSPSIVDLPEYYFDMVRAGLILTGFYTSENLNKHHVPVKPCVSLKARLVNVKTVCAGEGIGYGYTYHTKKQEIIGTVPFGFSDGYPRNFSNRGYAVCKGVRCPIRGNICMDQMMVDISDVPEPQIGDELIFYGEGEDGAITAQEAAELNDTIVDETLSRLSKRLPRVYIV